MIKKYYSRFPKAISSILAVTICCSLSAPVLALNTENESTSFSYTAETNTVIEASETTMDILNSDNKSMSANYSYNLVPQENNPDLADVDLTLHLNINDEVVPITASGSVNAYELTTGELLWEGPLDGIAKVNNNSFPAIIGFAKVNDKKEIQMGVTINPSEENEETIPIVYLVGDSVVNANSIAGAADTLNEQQNISNASARATDRLEYKGGFSIIFHQM